MRSPGGPIYFVLVNRGKECVEVEEVEEEEVKVVEKDKRKNKKGKEKEEVNWTHLVGIWTVKTTQNTQIKSIFLIKNFIFYNKSCVGGSSSQDKKQSTKAEKQSVRSTSKSKKGVNSVFNRK